MGKSIEEEIKQKAFSSNLQRAIVNIIFTASWLEGFHAQSFKPFGITLQQFNILRILRGIHPDTATIRELTNKMVDKNSNASRLVDKLEAKGLVSRVVREEDRRKVDVSITKKGLDLVNQVSNELDKRYLQNLKGLTEEELISLSQLLDRFRI